MQDDIGYSWSYAVYDAIRYVAPVCSIALATLLAVLASVFYKLWRKSARVLSLAVAASLWALETWRFSYVCGMFTSVQGGDVVDNFVIFFVGLSTATSLLLAALYVAGTWPFKSTRT